MEHGEETGSDCTISCGLAPDSGKVEPISDPIRAANNDGEFHGGTRSHRGPKPYTITAKSIANGGITPWKLLHDASNQPDPVWIINGKPYTRDMLLDQLNGMGGPDQDYELCGISGTCKNTLLFPKGGHPCGSGKAWCNYVSNISDEAGWLTLLDGGGGAPKGCSFSGETPVLMADGRAEAIKNIKVGDKVTATDPTTGLTLSEPVTQLHNNDDSDLVDVTVTTNTGTQTIHTTYGHPFWNVFARTWTPAGQLATGTVLLAYDGQAAIVTGTRPVSGHAHMRNLTIDALHTYYVIAGTTPVLVHNDPAPVPPIIQNAIDLYNSGQLSQRMTGPAGARVPDVFRGDTGPIGARRFWGGAAIYDVPGGGNDWRLLVKSDGTIGWVGPTGGRAGAGHNYDNISTYKPPTC